MTLPFPLELPAATALYVALYLATLALHFLLASYVLAGSVWIAVDVLLRTPREAQAPDAPARPARTLVDWMPFALGAAITAGVAPLLFVQVLYQRGFYTANLLLFPRWLAIVPALILAFYLLYLQKSRWIEGRGRLLHGAVSLGVLACVLLTAFSFATNHVLSIEPSTWRERYVAGSVPWPNPRVLARLSLWISGSFPTLCAALLWQGRAGGGGTERWLGRVALAGLVLSLVAAAWVHGTLDGAAREGIRTGGLFQWVGAAALGVALQAAVWVRLLRGGRASGRSLAVLSAGVVLTVFATVALREGIRLSALDIAALQALHEKAAAQGGLAAFLFFLALNAALIAWSVRVVRARLRP